MQNRDVAAARLRLLPRLHVRGRAVVRGHREQLGLVAPARGTGRGPAARDRRPRRPGAPPAPTGCTITADLRRPRQTRARRLGRQRVERRRPGLADVLQFVGQLELAPEVRIDTAPAAAAARPAPARTNPSRIRPKSRARSRASAASCARRTRSSSASSDSTASIRPATSSGSVVSNSRPPPSIVAGTAAAARAMTGTRL